MAPIKELGGGGEKRKETLADKPWDFENRSLGLSCHAPTFDAVTEMNFRGRVCVNPKYIFL